MIKNGIEFLDSFLYDIRNEYTGYVDQTSILQFVNETALNYVEELLKSKEDVIHDLNSLRVITTGTLTKYPLLGIASPRNLFLPLMHKSGNTNLLTHDLVTTKDYPNIIRLNSISVLKTKPWDNNDIKIIIVTKDLMPTINRKYYRKPDDDNERVYGYFLEENATNSIIRITGEWLYYVLDYYQYPSLISYDTNSIVSYDFSMLSKIKTMCVVRFLERIKDERFQNFVSKQQ